MSELVLTARCEVRTGRHSMIGVFQNGGKAGVLTVEAEHEAAVLGAINGHGELLKVLSDLVRSYDMGRGHNAVKLRIDIARDLIAKVEGTKSCDT